MGIYDRDYSKADYGVRPQVRMRMPQLTPVVKWLLIINVVMFVLSVLPGTRKIWHDLFPLIGLQGKDVGYMLVQPWRFVTYQFMHATTDSRGGIYIWHILMNMLGLYFLGPTLEKFWGSRRFLSFYLGCGIVGGLFYIILAAIGFLPGGILVGASGAILGMLAACAILFPQFVVILFIFPVPIRVASILITIVYLANVLSKGANAGGDATHLAGMAAGAMYVLWPRLKFTRNIKLPFNKPSKFDDPQWLSSEVDRILEKVNHTGINSLTNSEKRTLREATFRQQR